MAGLNLLAGLAGLGQFADHWQKGAEQRRLLAKDQQDKADEAQLWSGLRSFMGGKGGGDLLGGGQLAAPESNGGIAGLAGLAGLEGSAPGAASRYSPTPGASGFGSGLARLTALGVSPEVAQGAIDYMHRNESGTNSLAVNPTSGALGRAQWLGPRKAALIGRYGPQPSDDQQAEHMAGELQGSEGRTLANLLQARTAKEGYDIWGRDFERPGPAALAKAGVGGAIRRAGAGAMAPAQGGADSTGWSSPPGEYGSDFANGAIRGAGAAQPQAPSDRIDETTNPDLAVEIDAAPAAGEPIPLDRPETARPARQQPAVPVEAEPALTPQQVRRTANQVIGSIPMPQRGRLASEDLAQRIDQAMPGASPRAKIKFFEMQQKMLAPAERERVQLLMQQNSQTFQADRDDKRQLGADTRAANLAREMATRSEAQGGQLVDRGEQGTYRVKGDVATPVTIKGTGEPLGKVTKVGTGQGSQLGEAEATFWANTLAAGGALPGRLPARTIEQIIKKVPGSEGMSPGDFIAKNATVKADSKSLGNMTKMADAAISFEKLAEKNFDVALRLAPDAVPTDLGPFFNRWIEEGETMFGDPNVPPYVAAMITAANEYAKVMSGSTGAQAATVDSRKEARTLFSPYLSLPQISQVIAVAKADMKNRENTLNEQRDLIKQRLGSSAPVTIAPPAVPKRTGQESQSAAPGAPAAAPTAAREETATNPQTGERMVKRNGQWVPMQ